MGSAVGNVHAQSRALEHLKARMEHHHAGHDLPVQSPPGAPVGRGRAPRQTEVGGLYRPHVGRLDHAWRSWAGLLGHSLWGAQEPHRPGGRGSVVRMSRLQHGRAHRVHSAQQQVHRRAARHDDPGQSAARRSPRSLRVVLPSRHARGSRARRLPQQDHGPFRRLPGRR